LDVPTECPDIPSEVLDPKTTWQDRDAYDLSAKKLAQMFVDNFKKFKDAPQDIVNAGPKQ
jgi:phosphoenolpyruvate carboxykinase (ATP)